MWRVNSGVLEKNGVPVAKIEPISGTPGQWDIDDFSHDLSHYETAEDDGLAYSDDDLSNAVDAAYNDAIDDVTKIIDTLFDHSDFKTKKVEKLFLDISGEIEDLRK